MDLNESGTPDIVKVLNADDVDQQKDDRTVSSIYNAYKLAFMGDFDFNGFANTLNPNLCFLLFVFLTLIVNVTGLNSLVAILGDSYAKVMEHQSV